MQGRVVFWYPNPENPMRGFGFIKPDGMKTCRRTDCIYFNSATARYSPVRIGQHVEYQVREEKYEDVAAQAALKVEKVISDDDPQT